MSCELQKPSLYEQFIIFRMKLKVELILHENYQKVNVKAGYLDVMLIQEYQR